MLLESQSSAQESSVGSRASSIDLSFLIRMPINQSQFKGRSYKLGQVVDLTIPLYLNIYWATITLPHKLINQNWNNIFRAYKRQIFCVASKSIHRK